MEITIQKKIKTVNKVFKRNIFCGKNVSVNLFTDEIFYIIHRSNM